MTGSQFGQFFIKSDRQGVANFAKVFLYDGKVIDSPFGRGGDCMFLLNRLSGGTVILQQYSAVFGYTWDKRAAIVGIGCDSLSGGETLGVLFQALDAE